MMAERTLVFILGTQRSGTTWLANIFDSHPACLHYYEPFAPAYGVFPYFPHEFVYLDPPAENIAKLVRTDLPRLVEKRSRLFDPVYSSRRQFLFEAWLMLNVEKAAHRLHLGPSAFANQFKLIHLNRIGQKPVVYFPKRDPVTTTAIKDVRLYFKAAFLAHAFPDAKFIHVMRHPAAVVNSMTNYLARGRLIEIRANIDSFADTVMAQPRFTGYESLLSRVRDGRQADKLAAYWRVANETLAADLGGLRDRVYPLVYEKLATDPMDVAADMLQWCGLPMTASTEDYIRESSTSRSERKTVLDTNRVSATYYRDWVGKTPAEVLSAIEDVCAESPLMKQFAPYYD